MEKWIVIGFKEVNFKPKDSNRSIEGYRLYLNRTPIDNNTEGLEAAVIFISSEYVDYVPAVGDHIQISYNKYGKVDSITVIE